MFKKIKKIIVAFLIICICTNVYAIEDTSDKKCSFKFIKIQNKEGEDVIMRFATSLDGGGRDKAGYMTNITGTNGKRYFCIDPDLSGNSRVIYKRGDEVKTTGNEVYLYKAYKYYLSTGNSWVAQIAMWYFYSNVLENTTPTEAGLGVAIASGSLASSCKDYERSIQEVIHNTSFSCEAYLKMKINHTSNDEVEVSQAVYNKDIDQWVDINFSTTVFPFSGENGGKGHYTYLGLFKDGLISKNGCTYTASNGGICSGKYVYDSAVGHITGQYVSDIFNADITGMDKLYYYYPPDINNATSIKTEGAQRLIGPAGCGPDLKCQDGLDKIVNNHKDDYDGLTLDNSSYIDDLTAYQSKNQLEINSEWLKDSTWVADPKCYGGRDDLYYCFEDLDVLRTKTGTEYDNQYNLMLSRNKLYIDAEFNGDYYFPDCGDINKCTPEFSYSQCDNFKSNNNGFYISDTNDNVCWQDKNIAFTSNTVSKESKWNEASNRYCNVYCWEAAGADFPGAIKDIQAGQRFFWGRGTEDDGYFGNINASRKCITKNINYQLYYDDVVANEADISRKYDQVMADNDFNTKNSTEVTGSDKDCTTSDTATCHGHNEPTSCSSGELLDNNTCFKFTHLPSNFSTTNPHGLCDDGSQPTKIRKKDADDDDYVCGYSNLGAPTGGGGFVCDSCDSGYKLVSGTCYKEGTYYKKTQSTYGTATVAENKVCIANDVADKVTEANSKLQAPKTAEHKTALDNALNKRTSIQKEIGDCQSNGHINYSSSYNPESKTANMYTYNTSVKLTYGEKFWNGGASAPSPKSISGDDLLIQNGEVTSFSSNGTRGNTSILTTDGVTQTGVENVVTICTDVSGVYGNNYYGCTKNADGSILYSVPVYDNYTWNFAGYWKYYYNDQYFVWHFLKQSGIAKMKKEVTTTTTDFMFGGKYGFIASFNMVTNFYSFATVEVKNFGNNGHFNELFYELSADYTEDRTSTDTYTYYCPFHIENKMYGSECHYDCDFDTKICKLDGVSPEYCKNKVGGIDLVYRIIELTSAEKAAAGNKEIVFPGLVGTGRKLGSNWEVFYNNNREKYNKITTYDNIYDGGAIYTIDLTPAAIQAIRADNAEYRAKKKDPYTSMKDPDNNQKIKCTGETPQEQTCVSTWITGLRNGKVGATDIGVKLTGEYGELDTDARLAAIKRAKESTEASGTKNLLSTGGV